MIMWLMYFNCNCHCFFTKHLRKPTAIFKKQNKLTSLQPLNYLMWFQNRFILAMSQQNTGALPWGTKHRVCVCVCVCVCGSNKWKRHGVSGEGEPRAVVFSAERLGNAVLLSTALLPGDHTSIMAASGACGHAVH